MPKTARLFPIFLLCLMTAGCTSFPRQPAVPADAVGKAAIPGLPGIRYTSATGVTQEIRQDAAAAQKRIAGIREARNDSPDKQVNFLALSGGGGDGAFGSGFLVGWTASGTRPVFDLVTGVSTGALIAPFAFLGAGYDRQLQNLYTSINPRQIASRRGIFDLLNGESLADSLPLRQLIEEHVNDDIIRAIGREYQNGRNMLVGTTNLDAGASVIWNMGRLASSNHPAAPRLFRDILLASASIPGVFPPVMIDVEVEGIKHQELHVDGAATAQVILYPSALELTSSSDINRRKINLYVIRNARIAPDPEEVKRNILSIAGRAIASLINTQGVGDLSRLYLLARSANMDFNLTYIPSAFRHARSEEFDPAYMQALFKYGYGQAASGQHWHKRPPDLESVEDDHTIITRPPPR